MDLNNDAGASGGDTGTAADLLGGATTDDAGAAAGGAADDAAAGAAGGGDGGEPAFLTTLSADVGDGETASNRDWIKAKGFKDLDGLVKAYRFTEKGLHDSGRVKVPGEGAPPEEISAYRAAIGVPEDAKGYAVPEVKGADGKPIALNMPELERAMGLAHKHGVPKPAMDAILAEMAQEQAAQFDDQIKAQEKAAHDHVKGWGADKDAKLAAINAAAKEAGLTREDMQFLRAMPGGPAKMLDMLAKFGSSFSEDSLIRGDRQRFGVNAADAQKELDTMKADAAVAAKVKVPGSAENQRWNRLIQAVKAGAGNQAVENDFIA